MKFKLILVDGDETLWTFEAQEFIWASLLKPPLKTRTQDSLLDKDANILMLRDGARKFLEWCRDEGRYVNLMTHNDFHIVAEVLDLLDLWQYFVKPKISWRKKNKQLEELLEYMEQEGIHVEPHEILMIDDNIENYYDVEKQYGDSIGFIHMGVDVKNFEEVIEKIRELESNS